MVKAPNRLITELVETHGNGTIHPVKRPRPSDPLRELIKGFRDLQLYVGTKIINASKVEGSPMEWVILNGLELVNMGTDVEALREALNQAVEDCVNGFRMPGDNDLEVLRRPVAVRIKEVRAGILRVVGG